MTTEVIVETEYDVILVDGSENTILVEGDGQTTTIITSAEQGPQGPAGADGLNGATTITALTDVDLTNKTEGSMLVYSANTNTWVATTQLNNQSLESGQY